MVSSRLTAIMTTGLLSITFLTMSKSILQWNSLTACFTRSIARMWQILTKLLRGASTIHLKKSCSKIRIKANKAARKARILKTLKCKQIMKVKISSFKGNPCYSKYRQCQIRSIRHLKVSKCSRKASDQWLQVNSWEGWWLIQISTASPPTDCSKVINSKIRILCQVEGFLSATILHTTHSCSQLASIAWLVSKTSNRAAISKFLLMQATPRTSWTLQVTCLTEGSKPLKSTGNQ